MWYGMCSSSVGNFITDRKEKVMFSQVFVCLQSASWLLVHCSSLLWRGRYASYWNAFLFILYFNFVFVSKYLFLKNLFRHNWGICHKEFKGYWCEVGMHVSHCERSS